MVEGLKNGFSSFAIGLGSSKWNVVEGWVW